MKTLSSIVLSTAKEEFSVTRFTLKLTILLVATFLLLDLLGIPTL